MNDVLILIAQQNRPPFGGGGGGAEGGAAIAIQCVQCVISLVGLAIGIWWLITMYGAFNAISPSNREMEPGMVFLMFIPCFNIIWYFMIVLRMASSLEKEYRDRGLSGDGDFGKTLGIITFFAGLCPPAGWICQIMYINKIKAYTAVLPGGKGDGRKRLRDDDDDDEDDRPRKKRRRDEDDD